MKRRDRGQIPKVLSALADQHSRRSRDSTSLAAGWSEAVPESTELKTDTASAFYLDGKTTYPLNWTNIRKGDYVEAIQGKKAFRGWVSGFIDDRRLISISDFDWKRIGQFGESNIRLLDRNHGLLIERLCIEKERIEICKLGTVQVGIDNAW